MQFQLHSPVNLLGCTRTAVKHRGLVSFGFWMHPFCLSEEFVEYTANRKSIFVPRLRIEFNITTVTGGRTVRTTAPFKNVIWPIPIRSGAVLKRCPSYSPSQSRPYAPWKRWNRYDLIYMLPYTVLPFEGSYLLGTRVKKQNRPKSRSSGKCLVVFVLYNRPFIQPSVYGILIECKLWLVGGFNGRVSQRNEETNIQYEVLKIFGVYKPSYTTPSFLRTGCQDREYNF